MTALSVTDAHLAIDGAPILRGAALEVAPGALTVLLGPNGAGKTSLLRVALGLQRPDRGTARIDGAPAHRMSAAGRARRIAYLPQTRPLAWPQRVRDVVALGRFAHGATLGRLGATDSAAVEDAIAACDLTHLAARATDTLSGGELARVHLARALAARAPLIVADEPVASLDPLHQHQLLALLRRFVDTGGGALVVLHDLDLAARHADRLVWLQDGATVAQGGVADTLTPDRIAAVYAMRARIEGGRVLLDGPA